MVACSGQVTRLRRRSCTASPMLRDDPDVGLPTREVSEMSTKFSVEDNAVNQHATNLDTAVSSLNGQAASFLSAIESLPGVWKGSSFQSWDQLTQAWHEAMAQLNSALDDVKSRVGSAGQLYDTFESEQTSQLSSTMGSASWDATKFRG